MPGILDQIAAAAKSAFVPGAPNDLFALRLAARLGEPQLALHYSQLTEQYGVGKLLIAYRKALLCRTKDQPLGKQFHLELQKLNGNGNRNGSHRRKLAAFKVERRSVAVAIFDGERLDYTQLRQLSSDRDKAETSTRGFVNWVLTNFEIETGTLEKLAEQETIHRAVLSRQVKEGLLQNGVPASEVPKLEFISAYCYPAPASRRELRDIVLRILPALPQIPGILDAAGLGLFVQIEWLFMN